ncbi:hypothetical protein HY374_01110 [Candidatus Berkelbacteria bacterium]|nr:hypothetical protein [Candidatus Berkelbacteria bacterium]
MWLYLVADAAEHRITDDDGAGVLTLDTTVTPANTQTYEIHSIRPSLIEDAIDVAIRNLSNKLGRMRVDNSYVTDSPIFNAGFEDTTSATAITGWAATTATMTRESGAQNKLGGAYSVALTGSSGYISPTAEFADQFLYLAGTTPTLYVPCKTSTASAGRISWVINGTVTNSSYHTGGGGWETLSLAGTIPDPVNTVTIRLNRDAGTVYYDNIWIEGGPTMTWYRLPNTLFDGPEFIRIQDIGDRDLQYHLRHMRVWSAWEFRREHDEAADVQRNILHVIKRPRWGRWFMVANTQLTEPSARTDIVELDADDAELLEVEAALIILRQAGRIEQRQRIADLEQERARLLREQHDLMRSASLSVR